MKKIFLCLLGLIFTGIFVFQFGQQASSQNRRVASNAVNYPSNTRINVNPAANRQPENHRLIAQLIKDDEAVGGLIGEPDYIDNITWTLDRLAKEMKISRLELNGDKIPEYVIWASFKTGFCGATGNCSVWVYRKTNSGFKQLLKADTIANLSAAKTKSNGYVDIVLSTHSGAYETYIYTHKFNGNEYREAGCIVRSYISANGSRLKNPRIKKC